MSEPKFTSGEWGWDLSMSRFAVLRDKLGTGDRVLCCDRSNSPSFAPNEANARLIAAAPDLYAACDFVLDWLSSFSMPPTSTIQEKRDAIAVLERAIEKAGGKR